ncbi:MAG TPA: aminotransferase class V-fold PLP-dependent enzyme [Kofleriaceae bacterium]|nr:aminotransferase class V-fold PLP-dependent enzyme [Kofleriaceae bacterium]
MLEVPIYNKTLRKEVGRGELDYEVYLRTRELLALQTPANELVVPDELLFQVMHQTQELWLKCVAFETANVVEHLDGDSVFAALDALDRIAQITRVLAEQIRVMFTLSPQRFQVIRRSLGNGSGLESPGYNQLLTAAAAAFDAFKRIVERRNATLLAIYEAPEAYAELHRIAERFVDWDGNVQTWLVEHFMLVRRTIGIDKGVRALDGFPTVALGSRMTKPLFAELWNLRVEMTRAWKREGGFLPGEQREDLRVEPVASRTGTAEVEPFAIGSLRIEFPVLARCVYLNSNATGATPRAAKTALDSYWRTLENWRDEVWERWWRDLHAHADDLAELIRAPQGSVVCDTNLATLFSRVMSAFGYGERPNVVTTDLEFPSIPFTIRAFERYGAVAIVVPSRDGATIDTEAVVRAIDERTQLVCLSHATFTTGAVTDLEPIVRRAHEVGALVVLDAYQSVGTMPIDVDELGVDFLLGGAHKWLCGSYESAFLYVRPSLLQRLRPAATGWIAGADPLSFAPQTEWADTARRFAGGTPAMLPTLVSRPGLAMVRGVGLETIRALSLARTDRIIARADDAGLAVATPRSYARRGGIVALRFPGDAEIARALIASGFVCSYRAGLRIAPHFYNTDEEIDRFMDELVRRAREAL